MFKRKLKVESSAVAEVKKLESWANETKSLLLIINSFSTLLSERRHFP